MTGNYAQMQAYKYDGVNEDESVEFKGMYINLMDSICDANGSIPIFTGDKKLISHDGIHLTRAGAQMYAHILNLNKLLQ